MPYCSPYFFGSLSGIYLSKRSNQVSEKKVKKDDLVDAAIAVDDAAVDTALDGLDEVDAVVLLAQDCSAGGSDHFP